MRGSIWPLLILGMLIFGGVFFVRERFRSRTEFRKKLLPFALRVESETGISRQIIITQAEHESGAGNSGLSLNYFNLFGIKANPKWIQSGKAYVTLLTKEVVNGQTITTRANFRKYSSFYESMRDWAQFIKTNYPEAFKAGVKNDIRGFTEGLKKGIFGSYATDPNYGAKLVTLYSTIVKEVA